MSKPSTELGRRRVVQSVGVVGLATGLAGCSSIQSTHGATDVAVRNVAATALTVSVTVARPDADEPHTERTLELGAHESVAAINDSKLPVGGDYVVSVRVEGGPSETFEWTDTKLEQAPLHVVVDDGDNIDFLLKVA